MFTKQSLALICVVMALSQAAWGEAGCFAKDTLNGKESVTQELHPAGPTTRREWRSGESETLYRIQYESIRAGHLLIGQARLVRDRSGIWYVEPSNKKRLKLLGKNEVRTKNPKSFVEAKQVWRVCVTRQEIPEVHPGVATESEPSLDLVLVPK